MSEVQYFVYHYLGEGKMGLTSYTEEEMQDLLSWHDEDCCIGMEAENGCNKFIDLDDVDGDAPMEHACTIIRGEVILPKERKTVTEFEL